ncbi:helix-turn-helix transcriptional regulator [Corallococcus aberystwythensis]|uniref:XRE family transcriptional regulator n=1 Tax=Corallococcus aberystwythensis TaxID=2316722 RepID=A0A3A8QLC8_9BACT|nr:helix-turn-helix transcriptional regulator [Corallococcus aberystwythensis]RKH63974.1 XRE family transcriptional regulator [Corallococcus aberystwythensis]
MTDTARSPGRDELARFLRSRRERLRPEDVGLPSGSRRRTPGLRREELARLADVGVSWYTWLEQGRDIHVSEPLLERLVVALRLTPTERLHLFELAHGRPASRPVSSPASVSDALQRLLDAHPFPALVSTRRWDIVAWNAAATVLYADLTQPTSEERNGLWSLFMNPERRARMPAWEEAVRRAVAGFRMDAARAADRSEFDALVEKLQAASPEFARLWSEHDVVETPSMLKVIILPELGPIEFESVMLTHSEPDGRELRVSFYQPRPGPHLERARALFARP